jgi:hypothetical protein
VELLWPPSRLQREVNALGPTQYGGGDDSADRAWWYFRYVHVGDLSASRHLVAPLIPSHNFLLMKPTGQTFAKGVALSIFVTSHAQAQVICCELEIQSAEIDGGEHAEVCRERDVFDYRDDVGELLIRTVTLAPTWQARAG